MCDLDGICSLLRDDKITKRRQGKAQCETLLFQDKSVIAMKATDTMNLLRAAMEYEIKEIDNAQAKQRAISPEFSQFYRAVVKYCINNGQILSRKAISIIEHSLSMLVDETLDARYIEYHKNVLCDLLIPRITHSVPFENREKNYGLKKVIIYLQETMQDRKTIGDCFNQKLLRGVCRCLFLDENSDPDSIARYLFGWFAKLIGRVAEDASVQVTITATVADCCASLLEFQAINMLPVLLREIDFVLSRVVKYLSVPQTLEQHRDSFLRFTDLLLDAISGWDGSVYMPLHDSMLTPALIAVLLNLFDYLLSDSHLRSLVLAVHQAHNTSGGGVISGSGSGSGGGSSGSGGGGGGSSSSTGPGQPSKDTVSAKMLLGSHPPRPAVGLRVAVKMMVCFDTVLLPRVQADASLTNTGGDREGVRISTSRVGLSGYGETWASHGLEEGQQQGQQQAKRRRVSSTSTETGNQRLAAAAAANSTYERGLSIVRLRHRIQELFAYLRRASSLVASQRHTGCSFGGVGVNGDGSGSSSRAPQSQGGRGRGSFAAGTSSQAAAANTSNNAATLSVSSLSRQSTMHLLEGHLALLLAASRIAPHGDILAMSHAIISKGSSMSPYHASTFSQVDAAARLAALCDWVPVLHNGLVEAAEAAAGSDLIGSILLVLAWLAEVSYSCMSDSASTTRSDGGPGLGVGADLGGQSSMHAGSLRLHWTELLSSLIHNQMLIKLAKQASKPSTVPDSLMEVMIKIIRLDLADEVAVHQISSQVWTLPSLWDSGRVESPGALWLLGAALKSCSHATPPDLVIQLFAAVGNRCNFDGMCQAIEEAVGSCIQQRGQCKRSHSCSSSPEDGIQLPIEGSLYLALWLTEQLLPYSSSAGRDPMHEDIASSSASSASSGSTAGDAFTSISQTGRRTPSGATVRAGRGPLHGRLTPTPSAGPTTASKINLVLLGDYVAALDALLWAALVAQDYNDGDGYGDQELAVGHAEVATAGRMDQLSTSSTRRSSALAGGFPSTSTAAVRLSTGAAAWINGSVAAVADGHHRDVHRNSDVRGSGSSSGSGSSPHRSSCHPRAGNGSDRCIKYLSATLNMLDAVKARLLLIYNSNRLVTEPSEIFNAWQTTSVLVLSSYITCMELCSSCCSFSRPRSSESGSGSRGGQRISSAIGVDIVTIDSLHASALESAVVLLRSCLCQIESKIVALKTPLLTKYFEVLAVLLSKLRKAASDTAHDSASTSSTSENNSQFQWFDEECFNALTSILSSAQTLAASRTSAAVDRDFDTSGGTGRDGGLHRASTSRAAIEDDDEFMDIDAGTATGGRRSTAEVVSSFSAGSARHTGRTASRETYSDLDHGGDDDVYGNDNGSTGSAENSNGLYLRSIKAKLSFTNDQLRLFFAVSRCLMSAAESEDTAVATLLSHLSTIGCSGITRMAAQTDPEVYLQLAEYLAGWSSSLQILSFVHQCTWHVDWGCLGYCRVLKVVHRLASNSAVWERYGTQLMYDADSELSALVALVLPGDDTILADFSHSLWAVRFWQLQCVHLFLLNGNISAIKNEIVRVYLNFVADRDCRVRLAAVQSLPLLLRNFKNAQKVNSALIEATGVPVLLPPESFPSINSHRQQGASSEDINEEVDAENELLVSALAMSIAQMGQSCALLSAKALLDLMKVCCSRSKQLLCIAPTTSSNSSSSSSASGRDSVRVGRYALALVGSSVQSTAQHRFSPAAAYRLLLRRLLECIARAQGYRSVAHLMTDRLRFLLSSWLALAAPNQCDAQLSPGLTIASDDGGGGISSSNNSLLVIEDFPFELMLPEDWAGKLQLNDLNSSDETGSLSPDSSIITCVYRRLYRDWLQLHGAVIVPLICQQDDSRYRWRLLSEFATAAGYGSSGSDQALAQMVRDNLCALKAQEIALLSAADIRSGVPHCSLPSGAGARSGVGEFDMALADKARGSALDLNQLLSRLSSRQELEAHASDIASDIIQEIFLLQTVQPVSESESIGYDDDIAGMKAFFAEACTRVAAIGKGGNGVATPTEAKGWFNQNCNQLGILRSVLTRLQESKLATANLTALACVQYILSVQPTVEEWHITAATAATPPTATKPVLHAMRAIVRSSLNNFPSTLTGAIDTLQLLFDHVIREAAAVSRLIDQHRATRPAAAAPGAGCSL